MIKNKIYTQCSMVHEKHEEEEVENAWQSIQKMTNTIQIRTSK